MGQKRNRRTREEMIEAYKAKLAKLEAQAAGTYDDSQESNTLKRLKRRLRKTQTALRTAQSIVQGVSKEEGGWARSPISDKIAKTEARLASQRETERRSEERMVSLPFDIERLEALVEAAEAGQDVEFPSDLVPLGKPSDRSDEEHEARVLAGDSDSDSDN